MSEYIFPDVIAKFMKKVDMRTQYEYSLLSMTLMMVGLILFTIYAWIYMENTLIFNILLTFNTICGMMFMVSYLVTTFQQYEYYKQANEIDKINFEQPDLGKLDEKEVKEGEGTIIT